MTAADATECNGVESPDHSCYPSAPCAASAARPLFSVIIPTFNRASVVGAAIRSVLQQSSVDFELIVVDDGSTDGTRELLATYQPGVTVIRQHNSGVSAARNAGAAIARGIWLAFLDSDDLWDSNYLSIQKCQIELEADLVFSCADCSIQSSGARTQTYFELNGMSRALFGCERLRVTKPFKLVLAHGPWQIGSVAIRAEAFRIAGGFDESLTISEDLDLLARLSKCGPAVFLPVSTMHAFRSGDTADSLSAAADQRPLLKRESHDRMYQKLERLPSLDRAERRVVRLARSANQRAIGNVLLRQGQVSGARRAFWRAFVGAPSLASFGKLCLATIVGTTSVPVA